MQIKCENGLPYFGTTADDWGSNVCSVI